MRKLTVVWVVLVASLVFVAPVLAYDGIDGQAIDSLTLQPWVHGGDVWVVNNTQGNILATCRLDTTTGEIEDGSNGTCDYGDDALGFGGVDSTRSPGDEIEVIVNYVCQYSEDCDGGPNGDPGDSSVVYNELNIPIIKQLGYIKTGTGPNAITLANVTATSANLWLPVALAAVALVGLGAVVVVRKRR